MSFFSMTNGTLFNMLTVLIGGTLGFVIGDRLPERFTAMLFSALGLFTVVTGIHDALGARNSLVVLVGLLIGGACGEVLRIETQLERLGAWLQQRLQRKDNTTASTSIGEGFVAASLLFCVGPLTILGAIANGLNGDNRDLIIKGILDGFAGLALAATLGWGVLLSLGTIGIVQGGLSLSASVAAPALNSNPAIIPELVATGGFLLIGVGLRLLKIKDLHPGNFLPSLIVTPLLVVFVAALPGGITP